MDRGMVNRVCGLSPMVLSGLALTVVGLAVGAGWERNLKDEGAAAHLFQLLIVLQAPIILLFLATADWRRARPVVGALALQAAALVAAIGSVALFRL